MGFLIMIPPLTSLTVKNCPEKTGKNLIGPDCARKLQETQSEHFPRPESGFLRGKIKDPL